MDPSLAKTLESVLAKGETVRLICTEGTSYKFYEIKIIDRTELSLYYYEVACRYGRIGTKGQPASKGRFFSDTAAMSAALSVIDSKLKKGYRPDSLPQSSIQQTKDKPVQDKPMSRFSKILASKEKETE